MTDTIFFRLLDGVNRPSRLSDAIEELHENGEIVDAYSAEPTSLRQVPGSPFAYWVSETLRQKFVELTPFEGEGRRVCSGPDTGQDFRCIRAWWEVYPKAIGQGQTWCVHAKGGDFAQYYADPHLLLLWGRDGSLLRHIESVNIRNPSFYFRPGITWSLRTQSGISFRVLPAGTIFGHKGPAVFVNQDVGLWPLLAIANSAIFRVLVGLQMTFGSYEVGVIQRTPIPDLPNAQAAMLGNLAIRCVDLKRSIDSANEVSHAFHLPALLQTDGETLGERLALWQDRVSTSERQLVDHQREIDNIAFQLYGIRGEDRQVIEQSLSGGDGAAVSAEDEGAAEVEDAGEATAVVNSGALVADLLSYAVGCVFGRWDTRIALDPSMAPKLADPFAPLPVCSPGMLVGPDGLPARRDGIASEKWMRARPDTITPPPEDSVQSPTIPDSEYPLSVDWDGILVDDPDHADDVVRRVRDVLELLWGERADEIEGEACVLLGVKDLRTSDAYPPR